MHISTVDQDSSCKDKDACSMFKMITVESKESVNTIQGVLDFSLSLFSPVAQGKDWDLAHAAMARAL